MNCEACPLAWLLCPVGVMREALVFHTVPWMAIAIFAAVGLTVGRFLCGWVCPAGLVQDWLYKIPTRKFELPRWTRGIKYAVLFVSVGAFAWFFGKYHFGFFCNWCPVAAAQVALPTMVSMRDWTFDAGRVLRLGVLAGVIGLSIGQSRAFCKLLCPVGAGMALTGRLSRLRLRVRSDRCIECRKCDKTCPVQVPVMTTPGNVLARPECVGCLDCRRACPVDALPLGYRPGP